MEIYPIFLLISLALLGTLCEAQSTQSPDSAFLDALIRRGNGILERGRTELTRLRAKNSYFVEPVQAEVSRLEKFIAELPNLVKDLKITPVQLGLFEARLLKYENDMLTLLLIEEEAAKDPTFTSLIAKVDALLTRAYTELGRLVVEKGAGFYVVVDMQKEITQLKETEDEIKRLDAESHTNEKSAQVVERLLAHEQRLGELLFQAEHDGLFNPKV